MQALGINAIELMPTHEFNELEYHAYNPMMSDYKYDCEAEFVYFKAYDCSQWLWQRILCIQNALYTDKC